LPSHNQLLSQPLKEKVLKEKTRILMPSLPPPLLLPLLQDLEVMMLQLMPVPTLPLMLPLMLPPTVPVPMPPLMLLPTPQLMLRNEIALKAESLI